ncbi:sugar phosphate isomerase/epimerase [Haladaptatus sp. DYF46]|uniref:sugar phosphate isomerase/epimerase family protein n=1 Tax=Haladaptatus sp. DYF46 TaxID=2886041 RepID=UPI001E5BE5F6|nr:sugar phosphate isomerase/epimerase [Haladaptatus sp. DYF46]
MTLDMAEIGIQLFTLRDLHERPSELVRRVGDTAFRGVELYDPQFDTLADDAEQCRNALDETGIEVVGGHVRIERLETELGETLSTCRTLDVGRLVIPTYEQTAFASEAGIEEAATRLATLSDELATENVELLYHNHTFEFDAVDGRPAIESFAEEAGDSFRFEPDTGLACHAGYDPLALLQQVGERAPLVHLTDTRLDGDETLHVDPGRGIVDLEACIDIARQNGAEWLIYENGRTETPVESLDYSAKRFAEFVE